MLVCGVANNVVSLGFGRFLQALSVGALPVISTSMLAKIPEKRHSITFSYYHAVNLLAGPFAFIVAGYIVSFFNWRFLFVFMFLFSPTVVLLILLLIPKQISIDDKRPQSFSCYFVLFKHWKLNAWVGANAMVLSTFNIYFLAITYVLSMIPHIRLHNIGWLSGSIIIYQWIGLFLTIKLAKKIKDSTLIIFGVSLMLIGIILVLILAVSLPVNVYTLVFPAMLCAIGMAITFGPLKNRILVTNPLSEPFYIEAYTATAISIMSMLGTLSITIFHHANAIPVSVILLAMLAITSILVLFALKK